MSDRQLLDIFLDLVKIPSPSGQETAVRDYIVHYLSLHNVATTIDGYGNLIANIPGDGHTRLLTAHMDTVPPGNQITPQIKNGIITTDGSSILGADNKAALAAILYTITHLPSIHNSLEVVFTRSEEVGNLGAVNLDYRLLKSTFGFSFDYGESLGHIFTSSPYYQRFDIQLVGKAAHASAPHQAKNVIPSLVKLISTIPLGQPYPDTTLNVGVIEAGSARNTIPGTAFLRGEIRSPSLSRIKLLLSHIRSQLPPKAEFSTYLENPGFLISPTSHALSTAQRALVKNGLTPKLTPTFACFDANIFIQHGIEIINLSDGSSKNHTPQESISIKNLYLLTQIITQLSVS